MASWGMNLIALATLVVLILTLKAAREAVTATRTTLLETTRAANEARDATIEARRQTKVALSQGIAVLGADLQGVIRFPHSHDGHRIIFGIENYGEADATDIEVNAVLVGLRNSETVTWTSATRYVERLKDKSVEYKQNSMRPYRARSIYGLFDGYGTVHRSRMEGDTEVFELLEGDRLGILVTWSDGACDLLGVEQRSVQYCYTIVADSERRFAKKEACCETIQTLLNRPG